MTMISFGKYKNKSVEKVFEIDPTYCLWLYRQPLTKSNEALMNFLKSKFDADPDQYFLTWGKYKGKSIKDIARIDPSYIFWMKTNQTLKQKCPVLWEHLAELQILC